MRYASCIMDHGSSVMIYLSVKKSSDDDTPYLVLLSLPSSNMLLVDRCQDLSSPLVVYVKSSMRDAVTSKDG